MDIKSRQRLLASPDFTRLVSGRWRVALVLTGLLFALYYGYILLIATNESIVTTRLGTVPLGIPLGAGVILGAWVLTAIYVAWANRRYDPEVARLRTGSGE